MIVRKLKQRIVQRGGFTMVELMVAIAIFVTLLAITAGLIDLSNTSQRVRAATNQLQAMLEGARSRAFKNGSPVGVRLILDPNNATRVTSLMYVAAPVDPSSSTSTHRGTLRYVDLDPGSGVVPAIQYLEGGGGTSWEDLKNQQLLQPGVRIRIPADSGRWYYISGSNFLEDLTPVGASNEYDYTVMRVTDTLLDVSTTNGDLPLPDANPFNTQVVNVDYELDLSTVNVAYPGASPEEMPRGTCIDLVSSQLPSQWRVGRWYSEKEYNIGDWVAAPVFDAVTAKTVLGFFRCSAITGSGESSTSEPAWVAYPGSNIIDNEVTWTPYPSIQLDIMFAPNGTVYGSIGTAGVIHLVVGNTDDSDAGIHAWDLRDKDGDGLGPDHQSVFRAVTLFTNSGSVQVSPLDLETDSVNNNNGSAGADGIADNMFRYAMEGETAK